MIIGGHFRIRPTVDTFNRQQLYYPDTAILVTRLPTEAGVEKSPISCRSPTRAVASDRHQIDVLDSSLLRMTSVGFISPKDPMWTSTLDAMERELVTDSLVYRYDPAASPDGLRGAEGTFSLCTFMYVDSLARAGQLEKARNTFEKMLTYANHLGLYSEEIALTGEQIGNFPQAFTHLALIDAALTLDQQLDRGRAVRDLGSRDDLLFRWRWPPAILVGRIGRCRGSWFRRW